VAQTRYTQRERIRVFIVAPDYITGELLKNALSRGRRHFAVEASTGSSQEVIRELPHRNAHVALISEQLPDGPDAGIKVLHKLRDSHRMPAIMLLERSKPESVVNAFRGGARGVFHRHHSLKALSKCIQTVHEGQIWANTEDVEHILSALIQTTPLQFSNVDGIPLLTRREEDVARLVADGLKNREIAQRLGVREHSIRNYLYRIFEKLGVSTRVELILYAHSQRDRVNWAGASRP
jgi:two-component system nitrate/nitrite response regulator NarL